MCHPIKIRSVKVYFEVMDDRVDIEVETVAEDKTGVEIEAVAGVMNGLLAIFDVCKRYEKTPDGQYEHARITDILVVHKVKEAIV